MKRCWVGLAAVSIALAGCSGGGGGGPPAPAPVARIGPCGPALGYQLKAATPAKSVSGPVIELSWLAPVARADGSPLLPTDVAGYKLYVGDAADSFTALVQVGADATSFVLPANSGQRYRLVVSAYDQFGNEGECSPELAVQMP